MIQTPVPQLNNNDLIKIRGDQIDFLNHHQNIQNSREFTIDDELNLVIPS